MGQFAGPILQTVGAVVGAFGQVQNAYYEAAVSRNNAKIAQYNANIKLQEGQRAETIQRLKTATIIGEEKSGFAAGNIDVAGGSATDVMANTAMLGELDALTLRYNAEGEAQGLRQQARMLNSQANQQITAGWFGAASTLLGGGSSIADKWMTFDSTASAAGASTGSAVMAAFGGG